VRATDRVLVKGRFIEIGDEIADLYSEGDRIVASADGQLLLIPKTETEIVERVVTQSQAAFSLLQAASDDQISRFFGLLANRLADDVIMAEVMAANESDVEQARQRGRSTTRLALTANMRNDMIDALGLWRVLVETSDDSTLVEHSGWTVQSSNSALGTVAFVFEGRPNVLADATGVLRGRNTCVYRIGSDAYNTAEALMRVAVHPALIEAGLPEHCVMLLPSITHASAWALFSHANVALAVARGSGDSVALLGTIAQQHGIPVSLHGTGGAWAVVSQYDDLAGLEDIIAHSLDRKVCNTLNTIVILEQAVHDVLPSVMSGIRKSGVKSGVRPIVHLSQQVEQHLIRQGIQLAEVLDETAVVVSDDINLAKEWEWETTPEVTLVVTENIASAVELFNMHSPQFVLSVLSVKPDEEEYAWNTSNAPFFGNGMTRWVDGQYALNKPELGLSNWQFGRSLGRGGILSGDSVYTIRYRMSQIDSNVKR
jgi:glutamate-5-semialdehyde dehydrogenase